MRFRKLLLVAGIVVLTGAGCTKQPVVDVSQTTVNTPEPLQTTSTEPVAPTEYPRRMLNESLIGSWHADPMVASGFGQRFSFFENGTFLYIPSEYNDPDDRTELGAEFGTWKLTDRVLSLSTTTGLEITLIPYYEEFTSTYKVVPVTKQTTITLGALEETDPSIVYSLQRLFGETMYWKFSDTPEHWCPLNSKYYQENPDRDYKACELLLNTYDSTNI